MEMSEMTINDEEKMCAHIKEGERDKFWRKREFKRDWKLWLIDKTRFVASDMDKIEYMGVRSRYNFGYSYENSQKNYDEAICKAFKKDERSVPCHVFYYHGTERCIVFSIDVAYVDHAQVRLNLYGFVSYDGRRVMCGELHNSLSAAYYIKQYGNTKIERDDLIERVNTFRFWEDIRENLRKPISRNRIHAVENTDNPVRVNGC